MRTKVRDFVAVGLSGAALLAAVPMLPGCNVVAGLWALGASESPERGLDSALPLDGSRQLSVSLRPGVALFQAAKRAPLAMSALSRMTRGRDESAGLDGAYLRAVSSGLLDQGLLIPGPLGMMEVRMEVQPIAAEPIAVEVLAEPDCAETSIPPALVGAYRAGPRLLLLRADGQFVLQGGARATETGHFALRCQVLQLVSDSAEPRRLEPVGHFGWRDDSGSAYFPLTAQLDGDVP